MIIRNELVTLQLGDKWDRNNLHDESWVIVSQATPDIWVLQAKSDIDGLKQALKHPAADVRRRAATSLHILGAVSAVSALKAAFAKENDPEAKASIAIALDSLSGDTGELNIDELVDQVQLTQQTQSPPSTETPDQEPTPAPESPPVAKKKPVTDLLKPLEGLLPEVIIDDRTIELLAILKNGTNKYEIIRAAHELGANNQKAAIEPLMKLFNDPTQPIQVRFAVADALIQLESATIEVSLLAALRSDDWQKRRNAAAILGQLKAEWALQPLMAATRDANPVVRRTAWAAIKHIDTAQTRKALQYLKSQILRTQQLHGDASSVKIEMDDFDIDLEEYTQANPVINPEDAVPAPSDGLLKRVSSDDNQKKKDTQEVRRPISVYDLDTSELDPQVLRDYEARLRDQNDTPKE